ARFPVRAGGDRQNAREGLIHVIEVPGRTSDLAPGGCAGEVQGVPGLREYMEERCGATDAAGEPVSYSPNLALTYWSFRLMIGFAIFSAALAVAALYLLRRKGAVTGNRWFARLCLVAIPMPFVAASFGWIFTETGRQPWVVVPNPTGVDMVRMLTSDG